MDALLLEDWVTIALGSGVSPTTVTQGADSWLRMPTIEDAVFWLDVRQPGTNVSISYQTAPRREDSAFGTMLTVPFATATLRSDSVLAKYAPVPVAKYVRWQLSFPGAGSSATFRVLLATYSLG